jgi:hypothetical protein
VRVRVSGPVGSKVRVPVTVAVPGAKARTARTKMITIIDGGGVAVTG